MKENGSQKQKQQMPKTVSLLGEQFDLLDITEQNLEKYRVPEESHGAQGLSCWNAGMIMIKPDMHLSRKQSTILHEIIHMLILMMSIPVPEKDNEKVVTALSQGLWEVLANNKKLREYLLQ